MTRSLLLDRFPRGTPFWNLGKTGWRSSGVPAKIEDHEQKEWKDRKPPGRGPLAISPTLKEVIVWRSSEIINNFHRKIKKVSGFDFGN